MASAKDTFEAATFSAATFAAGAWRGIGAPDPSDAAGVEFTSGNWRPQFTAARKMPHLTAGNWAPHFTSEEY